MNVTNPSPVRTSTEPAIPSREELVARARAFYPRLRARGAAAEAARKVPDETIAEMKAAGLFNIVKPKEYGGYELPYSVLCEVAMEIAKGCPSSGWIIAVIGEHNQSVAAYYTAEAQREVWGQDPETLIGSGNAPGLKAERVAGGWVLNGVLNFSSGCDFVDWHIGVAVLDGVMHKILFPQVGCEIVDNWHVMGLSGTGSKDVKIEDVFLPEHRVMGIEGFGPRYKDTPLYRHPQWSTNPFSLASAVVGAAEGAWTLFVEEMKTRAARSGSKIGEFQSMQLRIAESAAELEAARRLILGDLEDTHDYLARHDGLPDEIRARNQRDMAYAPMIARRAVDRLFYALGGAGLFLSHDMQRFFRDVNAGAQQFALNWDVHGTTFGKVTLGLDPRPVRW